MENEKDGLKKFFLVRYDFETFLIKYKTLVNQVVIKYGSGLKSYLKLESLFHYIVDFFATNSDNINREQELLNSLKDNLEFSYLRPEETELDFTGNKDFTPAVKSATFIKEALNSAVRCKLCNGYIHVNSMTFDHKDRKQDGGLGNIGNAQLAHPFCNSGIKN